MSYALARLKNTQKRETAYAEMSLVHRTPNEQDDPVFIVTYENHAEVGEEPSAAQEYA